MLDGFIVDLICPGVGKQRLHFQRNITRNQSRVWGRVSRVAAAAAAATSGLVQSFVSSIILTANHQIGIRSKYLDDDRRIFSRFILTGRTAVVYQGTKGVLFCSLLPLFKAIEFTRHQGFESKPTFLRRKEAQNEFFKGSAK